MPAPRDDLGSRLAAQHAQRRYRLRRAVRQFSHRLRAAGLVGGFFFLLIFLVISLLQWRLAITVPPGVSTALFVLAWLYLASLPLLLLWRTRLSGYVLQEHWVWLATWFVLPIDYFVLQFSVGGWRWIPILFFTALILGRLLRGWRDRRFAGELETHSALWDRLLPLGVLDLLLLAFWNVRQDESAAPSG